MRNSEIIKCNVTALLKEHNRWMTANEMIECGDAEHLSGLTRKNSFLSTATRYEGHSHPVYRVLTGMVRADAHKVYTPQVMRRIRKSGPQAGCYEYALRGTAYYFRRYREAIKNL